MESGASGRTQTSASHFCSVSHLNSFIFLERDSVSATCSLLMESDAVSQRSRGRVRGCFLRGGWMIRGQGGNKKKKEKVVNEWEPQGGEKEKGGKGVCVWTKPLYTHTHTRSCQDWPCLQPSFLFSSRSSKLSSSSLSSLPALISIVFVSRPG